MAGGPSSTILVPADGLNSSPYFQLLVAMAYIWVIKLEDLLFIVCDKYQHFPTFFQCIHCEEIFSGYGGRVLPTAHTGALSALLFTQNSMILTLLSMWLEGLTDVVRIKCAKTTPADLQKERILGVLRQSLPLYNQDITPEALAQNIWYKFIWN